MTARTTATLLGDARHDPDPLPRAAPVGPGSLYAGLPAAALVVPDDLGDGDGDDGGAVSERAVTPLRSWRMTAYDDDPAPRAVVAPHTWSRDEPDLCDHKGPV